MNNFDEYLRMTIREALIDGVYSNKFGVVMNETNDGEFIFLDSFISDDHLVSAKFIRFVLLNQSQMSLYQEFLEMFSSKVLW